MPSDSSLQTQHLSAAGVPDRLEVALEAKGQTLVLSDFPLKDLEIDSALALLEHLAEG